MALHLAGMSGSSARSRRTPEEQAAEFRVLDYLALRALEVDFLSERKASIVTNGSATNGSSMSGSSTNGKGTPSAVLSASDENRALAPEGATSVREETLRSATHVSKSILAGMVRKKWLTREDVSAPQDATRTVKIAVLKVAEGKLNDNQRVLIDTLAASGGRVPLEILQSLEVPRTTLGTLVRRGLVEIVEEPADFTVSRTQASILPIRVRTESRAASPRSRACVRASQRASSPACCCTASPAPAKPRSIWRACAACSKPDAPPSCSSLKSASRPPSPPTCIRSSAMKSPSCTPRSPTKNAPSSGIASSAATRAWSSARAPRSSRRSPISRSSSSTKSTTPPTSRKKLRATTPATLPSCAPRWRMPSSCWARHTPSLESYFNAKKNKYALVELPDRVEQRPLPEVEIIDMRQEFQETGHEQVISRKLAAEIKERLDRKEQVMVLLNRRGYSPVVLCRTCGKKLECQNCAIALTHHKREHKMVCHYCGYHRARARRLRALRQRVCLFSRDRLGEAGRITARNVSAGAHRPPRPRHRPRPRRFRAHAQRSERRRTRSCSSARR